ncbi:hypothetical protein Barba19A_gp086 [Rheinheimera phage vB_RspM_Barba19A]|jgi:hypothetical protein|uniref:Uncharacterized protein n=2 Tax=Barbavirus barba19A TaxID=2734091 RepID=A0A4P8NHH0_9CAUD|nr:hypothetical protein HOV47_gp086 [Rheinheimera phage vB_RspM_Barba19A]QCQ61926.1 hypothetical protein Barba19A_gp086 [Rheinheimera phage vB_RspM_Barba19A]QCQ64676.1 hypothetical protein Barba31A_gp086 [Rheinheimera phage vB_RspM_Barba31A]
MSNKFKDFKLKTVYAYTSAGNYRKYENVLVDIDRQKLIYCSYRLSTPKDTKAIGVDCYILDIPMTIMDGGVEASYHTMVHKINSGHYKKADYDDIVLEHNRDFSIFM